MLAHTHAIAGDRAKAMFYLDALQVEAKNRYVSPYDIAVIYAGLGDKEHALAQLKAAREDRSSWMVFLNVDPRLDGLRGEADFREIAKALK